jgi:hypothetical protein
MLAIPVPGSSTYGSSVRGVALEKNVSERLL